jgi:selenocysteine-specific elongation factor
VHVIGTAGHVDHGKSALIERLTGIDPDRLAEEKRRGLTIDLGFAWLTLPSGTEVGIIDVPGHERFIKNMLAGAGGISICLFVVDANEGWMPQSAEHLAVLEVLGIRGAVVAVTKSDTVDAETLALAIGEAESHLAGTSLAGAPIVSCSAVTGEGIDDLLAALDDVIAATPPAPDLGRARLWIDRVFSISGAGTVVTGTLAGGRLAAGDEVAILTSGRARPARGRIRTIQNHKKEVSQVGPGNRVALNLAGLPRDSAHRGDAVVHPGWWHPTARVDAELIVLPASISGRAHELTEKGAHLLYAGSAETPVRIRLMNTEVVGSGEHAYAQLNLRDPLPLTRGDRFVLRDAGRVLTYGGGVVLDPLPSVFRRKDPDRSRLLAELLSAEPADALRALVGSLGEVDVTEAFRRSGASEVPAGVTHLGNLLMSVERVAARTEALRAELRDYHEQNPLEPGMGREAIRSRLGLPGDAFDDLVAAAGDVVAEGAIVRLASHRVVFSARERTERAAVVQLLDANGFSPPLRLPAGDQVLRALVDSGELVKIDGFYLTAERAAAARKLVREKIAADGPVTVAQIRDLLQTSRKYAVPLSEWLDQTGATARRGDLRVLGPNP